MLQRMVANLLDNAIRYTPAGGAIEAQLRCGGGTATLAVRDSGIGIAPLDLPHIFDRFFRCDPSRSDTGAGLGLSLVRAVCQAHGGRVAVESAPGQGSRFTVTLPL
jgi:signal transduction histidine kinase